MKMWSGRFRQPLDADFERWQRSFEFDRRLLREELAASRAHAGALKNAGVLYSSELIAILQGFDQIAGHEFEEPVKHERRKENEPARRHRESAHFISGLLCAVEGRRPRHPHLAAGQGGVREAAVSRGARFEAAVRRVSPRRRIGKVSRLPERSGHQPQHDRVVRLGIAGVDEPLRGERCVSVGQRVLRCGHEPLHSIA